MRRLRIALTGTRGVIGSLLAERLEEDPGCRRLILLDLVPPKRKLRKAVFYRVDLTDSLASIRLSEALRREEPDVVVHLAFLQNPIRNPSYVHELESVGTMHLLHALADYAGGRRDFGLVVGSSTLVYGAYADNPNFLSEEAPLRGRRGYALVQEKVDAERQVAAFRSAFGVPVVVLRAAPVLGPVVRSLASRYFSLRAVPTVLGFNPLIQLLHPEDAVEAYFLALRRLAEDGVSTAYNVAGRGVLPLLAAIRLIGKRNLPLPGFAATAMLDTLFQAGAAIAPAAHLDYLRHLCVADCARAASELGFMARYSAREAVAAFARERLQIAA
ncbi:MAG: NAD-dependent epimerase/dehydratase family protein [Candidatus Binatia bacterium]